MNEPIEGQSVTYNITEVQSLLDKTNEAQPLTNRDIENILNNDI